MKTNAKLFLLALLLLLFGCNSNPEPEKETKPLVEKKEKPNANPINADSLKGTVVIPTLENKIPSDKNVIYSAAFMFAWHESEKQFGGNVIIDKSNSIDFKTMVQNKTYGNVLLPDEYVAQGSVDKLTGEVVASALFTKQLPFRDWFHRIGNPVKFNGKGMFEYFGITSYQDEAGIMQMKIRHYKNNDAFIISLQPKDEDHEILLVMDTVYKGTLKDIYTSAQSKIKATAVLVKNNKIPSWKTYFTKLDMLSIPAIEFFIKNRYHNIERQNFKAGNKPHFIAEAWQSINFKLDRKGATLEDIGYMMSDSSVAETEKPQPKLMVFNKPFALFLKRKDAEFPYFALMVNNSELLVPFKNN